MKAITNKLKEIYAIFQSSYNPLFWSESNYTVIVMCKHTEKTKTINL